LRVREIEGVGPDGVRKRMMGGLMTTEQRAVHLALIREEHHPSIVKRRSAGGPADTAGDGTRTAGDGSGVKGSGGMGLVVLQQGGEGMSKKTEMERRLDLMEEALRMQQEIIDRLMLTVQSHQRIFETLGKELPPTGKSGRVN
jgi:hypothetical protein